MYQRAIPIAICLPLAAAASGLAHSQSTVTIYGIVDASITTTTSHDPVERLRTNRLDSGAGYGSRLGFRVTEDLGGGLKANVLLEQGLAADMGTLQQGGSAFGRQSYLGLSGTHWSVSAGRQYSPINTLIAASDAFGQTYWGNSQGTGIGQQSPNATPATGGFQAAARINNSLLYSGTYGAWTARVMGSSGDEIKSAGRSIGASLAYQSGPAFASVAVHRGRQFAADIPAGATPDWQQSWAVGGAYDFSLVKLFGGYYRFTPSTDNLKVTAATTLRSESGWLGARIPVSPNNTVITQLMLSRYRHMDGVENGKALTMGLAFEHALSKRTALYAAWGRLNNNATSSNWLWGSTVVATPARAGADVSALSVGMWHRF